MKKNSAEQKIYKNSAYALIIGGALANMVDRVYNGFVVDFLDFLLGYLSLSGIQYGRYCDLYWCGFISIRCL